MSPVTLQLAEVAQALILYELGSIRTIPDHYNIREVYNFTSNTTPVVFVLPNDLQDIDVSEGTKGNSANNKRFTISIAGLDIKIWKFHMKKHRFRSWCKHLIASLQILCQVFPFYKSWAYLETY
jgi:hypothetical protein